MFWFGVGATPDGRTHDGNTPLSLACHRDRTQTIQALLARFNNLNVNNQDKDNDTPLLYTTFNGNLEMSLLLIQNGADPDLANSEHTTPLWNAVFSDNPSLVRALLRHNVRTQLPSRGIDQTAESMHANLVYDTPMTPLQVSFQRNHSEVFELLVEEGAGCDVNGNEEWVESLPEEWSLKLWRMRSLMSLSRQAVRRACTGSFENRMSELELPRELNAYLLFRD